MVCLPFLSLSSVCVCRLPLCPTGTFTAIYREAENLGEKKEGGGPLFVCSRRVLVKYNKPSRVRSAFRLQWVRAVAPAYPAPCVCLLWSVVGPIS